MHLHLPERGALKNRKQGVQRKVTKGSRQRQVLRSYNNRSQRSCSRTRRSAEDVAPSRGKTSESSGFSYFQRSSAQEHSRRSSAKQQSTFRDLWYQPESN